MVLRSPSKTPRSQSRTRKKPVHWRRIQRCLSKPTGRAHRRRGMQCTSNKVQKPRASKLKATETQCDASQNKTRNSFTRITLEQSFACRSNLSFAGLVALARSPNPIPSRTRPLNSSAPMVLCLKTWESRSLPGLQKTDKTSTSQRQNQTQKHRDTNRRGQSCQKLTRGGAAR